MSQKKGKSSQAIWIVAGAAVLVVGGLIALSQLSAGKESAPPATVQTGENSDQAHNVVRGVWGSENAKVVLEEYLDYG